MRQSGEGIMIKSVCVALLAGLGASFVAAPGRAETPAYHIAARIKVPDGAFDYATFDAATGRAYMPRGSFTTVLDVKTNAVSRLENGASDHIALPVPGTSLLVLTQRAGTIRILDASSDKVLADLPGGKNPNSAVYDPVTKLVVVLNKQSGDAALVDPMAKKVVATVPISPNTLEFPVTDGKGKVFDNVETTAEIVVLDTASRKITATYKLAGCEEPTGLAYADGLLVSSCGNGVAKVVRAADGADVASVPIGKGPDAAIYDPVRKLAFIPCGADGVVDVISLSDPKRPVAVQRIKTETGSRTGTLDPKTGRLYVIASKPDTGAVVPPGGRAPRLAGSWEILVIEP